MQRRHELAPRRRAVLRVSVASWSLDTLDRGLLARR